MNNRYLTYSKIYFSIKEKKGRIEFLIPNKVIDKFGRSAMKLEMQRLWMERYEEETGETID